MQEGADVQADVCWIGDGLDGEWADLTRENPASIRKFSVQGGTPFSPSEESGTVSLEIKTYWRGADCFNKWEIPYHLDHKFAWPNLVLDTTQENLRPAEQWRNVPV